jgi:hypothetical protein
MSFVSSVIRVVVGGRSTTFIALRIVYKEGYNSLASNAIWPIAIVERPEKRGPFRRYTQPLRVALQHVQTHGLFLSAGYVEILNNHGASPSPSPPRTPRSSPQPSSAPADRPIPHGKQAADGSDDPSSSPSSSSGKQPVDLASAAAVSSVKQPADLAAPSSPVSPASLFGFARDAVSSQEEVDRFVRLCDHERQRREAWRARRQKRREVRARGQFLFVLLFYVTSFVNHLF